MSGLAIFGCGFLLGAAASILFCCRVFPTGNPEPAETELDWREL